MQIFAAYYCNLSLSLICVRSCRLRLWVCGNRPVQLNTNVRLQTN